MEGIPPSVRLGLAPSLEHLDATSLPLQGVALGKVQSILVDLVAAQMATQYTLPVARAIEAMLDSQTTVVNTVFAGMTKVVEARVSQVNAISQIIATAIDRDVLGQFGSLVELANGFKGRGRYTFRPELETWLRRLDEEDGGRWMDVADEAEKAAGIASGQLAVESQVRESAGLHEAAVYETIRAQRLTLLTRSMPKQRRPHRGNEMPSDRGSRYGGRAHRGRVRDERGVAPYRDCHPVGSAERTGAQRAGDLQGAQRAAAAVALFHWRRCGSSRSLPPLLSWTCVAARQMWRLLRNRGCRFHA